MKDALHVVVPVAIVHVGNESTCSQGKVRWIFLDGAVVGQFLDEDNLLAVWRETESLDTGLVMGELFAVSSVWVHAPELSVADKGDFLSVSNPCGITLALGISGEGLLVLSIGVHDEEHLVTLVLLDAVVTYLVHDLLAVGRSLGTTNSPHGP